MKDGDILLQRHSTEILHDSKAIELVRKASVIIRRTIKIRNNIADYNVDFETKGKLLLEWGSLIRERESITIQLEESFHIVRDQPHSRKLNTAWDKFKNDGDDVAFLDTLQFVEKAMIKNFE